MPPVWILLYFTKRERYCFDTRVNPNHMEWYRSRKDEAIRRLITELAKKPISVN